MNAAPDAPLRAALEAQLDDAVQRHATVLWLDPQRAFDAVARALAPSRYTFVRFDGSWLEVMLALDAHTSGNERARVVLYAAGFDAASIAATPALAFVECARHFAPTVEKLLRDAAAGAISPPVLDEFIARGPVDFARAEQWLASERGARDAQRSDVLTRISLSMLVDELVARTWDKTIPDPTPVHVLDLELDSVDALRALEEHLRDRLGFDRALLLSLDKRPAVEPRATDTLAALCDELFAWLLCVEYVFDLPVDAQQKRAPSVAALAPVAALHESLARECGALCAQLRNKHERHYPAIADQVEQLLRDELQSMSAEALGRIDTFAIENKRVLEAAVSALKDKRFSAARERAADRLRGDSIWLRLDQLHRWEWQLVLAAAEFGETLERVGMPPRKTVARAGETLADLVAWYESSGYEVDLRHRRFEQEKAANLDPRFANFAALQEVVRSLREQYRGWVDAHAQRWTECCELRGYLAPSELQQRTLYEQVVQPIVEEGERVALFLVDALRYEMARDLSEMLQREAGTTVALRARVAELPTITAVGMNCVVPVAGAGDRLRVAGEFAGFRSSEITVSRPDHRADVAGRRSHGKRALLLDLSTVLSDATDTLRNRIKGNKLLLVQTREIDDAGEANVGVRAFQGTLQDLLSAVRLLEAAGVQRFVFVADHGFLLQDECTRVEPFGTKRIPRPRYVVDTMARVEANVVAVNPRALGYEGDEIDGKFLLFRRDTAVFATGNAGAAFVHGGNSPQERIIPVLEARTPARAGRSKALARPRFAIAAEALSDVLGVHRLRFRVLIDPAADSLFVAAPVTVGLRARGGDDSAIVSIRDVSSGTHSNGQLQVTPVREHSPAGWTEVFFTIESPRGAPTQVEVSLADAVYEGSARLIEAWFESARVGPKRPTSNVAMPAVDPAAVAAATADGPSASASTRAPDGAATVGAGGAAGATGTAAAVEASGAEKLGAKKSVAPAKPAVKREDERSWLDAIPDDNARKVLARVAQYGMVTEAEATELLGSARAMRRFGLQLDEWIERKLIPIRIRVDSGADGKRYTKEGDR